MDDDGVVSSRKLAPTRLDVVERELAEMKERQKEIVLALVALNITRRSVWKKDLYILPDSLKRVLDDD